MGGSPALYLARKWHRILKAGHCIIFTDPVVRTGPVFKDELAVRSNIGFFLFVRLEATEQFITEAEFRLLRQEDATRNTELT